VYTTIIRFPPNSECGLSSGLKVDLLSLWPHMAGEAVGSKVPLFNHQEASQGSPSWWEILVMCLMHPYSYCTRHVVSPKEHSPPEPGSGAALEQTAAILGTPPPRRRGRRTRRCGGPPPPPAGGSRAVPVLCTLPWSRAPPRPSGCAGWCGSASSASSPSPCNPAGPSTGNTLTATSIVVTSTTV
jgi:hypothetical protein